MSEVTQLLTRLEKGDASASEELLPLVYEQLKQLAGAKLRHERVGISIQPTMLVHEAYLRLVEGHGNQEWSGRGHFFASAAEAMRRILVENARRRLSLKQGGAFQRAAIEPDELAMEKKDEELLEIHEALELLEEKWPEKAQLVKLRYFAGMTIPEAAGALRISISTAERHWMFAKAWLHAKLKP